MEIPREPLLGSMMLSPHTQRTVGRGMSLRMLTRRTDNMTKLYMFIVKPSNGYHLTIPSIYVLAIFIFPNWTTNMPSKPTQRRLLRLPIQHSNTHTSICDQSNIGSLQKYLSIIILQNLFCGRRSVKLTNAWEITKRHQECTRLQLPATKRGSREWIRHHYYCGILNRSNTLVRLMYSRAAA